MVLTGSTKRSDWDIRWIREQPKDWERGRIAMQGDRPEEIYEAVKGVIKILGVVSMIWITIALWFCISGK